MKILVVGSGFDIIPLFKILNKFDHQYLLVLDLDWWAWWDKSKDFVEARINKIINNFSAQIDKIILPPLWEVLLNDDRVIPLFKNYMLYALSYSLVGKIWFVWDVLDRKYFQDIFYNKILKDYNLTDRQKSIRKFNKKFPIWIKQTLMWKYYLMQFWTRDRMVRKTIKVDLKYFKDADVDTLIPLNWWYLAFDNILRKYLKFKRIRYHSLPKMLEVYLKQEKKKGFDYVKINEYFSMLAENQQNYNVEIFYTWQINILTEQKRFLWLLARGKEIDLKFKKIEL